MRQTREAVCLCCLTGCGCPESYSSIRSMFERHDDKSRATAGLPERKREPSPPKKGNMPFLDYYSDIAIRLPLPSYKQGLTESHGPQIQRGSLPLFNSLDGLLVFAQHQYFLKYGTREQVEGLQPPGRPSRVERVYLDSSKYATPVPAADDAKLLRTLEDKHFINATDRVNEVAGSDGLFVNIDNDTRTIVRPSRGLRATINAKLMAREDRRAD